MSPGPAAVERAAALLGDRAERAVPLGPFTTYKVGGPAALLVRAAGPDDLAAVGAAVAATGVDVLVVGKGSNLLVADAGFAGVAVVLGEAFAAVEIDGTRVRAGGAAALPVVARHTVRAGLTGFEWAVGVPGSVGGAVRMNAGGHGSDMAATLETAEIVDLAVGGEARTVVAADLALGYRRSAVAATPRGGGGDARPGGGGPRGGGAHAVGDRGLAPGQPARRPERGIRVHEPAGGLGRSPDRRRRLQGPAPRDGGGVDEARELRPGRPGRIGRRRAGPDGRGAAPGGGRLGGFAGGGDPHRGLRVSPST